MGHIAFKLLRPKDAFLFRGFAADCVTLLTGPYRGVFDAESILIDLILVFSADSMDALSLLFSQESDPNHMDDTPAALLAFASLTPSNTPQDTTNSIEIPLGNMERCVSLIVRETKRCPKKIRALGSTRCLTKPTLSFCPPRTAGLHVATVTFLLRTRFSHLG